MSKFVKIVLLKDTCRGFSEQFFIYFIIKAIEVIQKRQMRFVRFFEVFTYSLFVHMIEFLQ